MGCKNDEFYVILIYIYVCKYGDKTRSETHFRIARIPLICILFWFNIKTSYCKRSVGLFCWCVNRIIYRFCLNSGPALWHYFLIRGRGRRSFITNRIRHICACVYVCILYSYKLRERDSHVAQFGRSRIMRINVLHAACDCAQYINLTLLQNKPYLYLYLCFVHTMDASTYSRPLPLLWHCCCCCCCYYC